MSKKAKELKESFDKCVNDKERWEWVLEHRKEKFTISLDNDDTFIIFEDDMYGDFDSYLGWSDGIRTLLRVLNIKEECV